MASSVTLQDMMPAPEPTTPIETQIKRAISRIAESNCPILVMGERGVGKRSFAAQIHAGSHRSGRNFTEIACADAKAQELLSVLSSDGTVYLTEVGDLSLSLQELILDNYLRSDRAQCGLLLCGTSRELLEEVKSRRMREDFYYQISAITLRISPLRCRKSEILSIADSLLTQYSKRFDRPKPVLRKEIVGFLMEHCWPGNLPELQTAIKTFVAIGDQSISLAAIKAATPAGNSILSRKPISLKDVTRAASTQIERQLISETLLTTGGNRKRAADDLGISYKALLYKLKQAEADYRPAYRKNGVQP